MSTSTVLFVLLFPDQSSPVTLVTYSFLCPFAYFLLYVNEPNVNNDVSKDSPGYLFVPIGADSRVDRNVLSEVA